MVKMMNYEFKIVNLKSAICYLKIEKWPRVLRLAIALALSLIIYNSQFNIALAQQPQAPAGTPLYAVNAKYVNGMAPGYRATEGSGLILSLSAGTAYCGNPPAPVSYPGGSLSLTASATNYVYLDPAQNCSPVAGTSAFVAGEVPIAIVVTGATSITSITDARTWFTPQPCVTSTAGAVNCSATGANQNITLTPSGTGSTVVTNLQDKGGQVFNVKAYGAKGNGTTDDTPAFQAAYNAAVAAGGGTVLVPQTTSCYMLDSPVNMTSTSNTFAGVTIEGVSVKRVGVGVTAPGTICGNTGGIVFDTTGSNGIMFRDLDVTSEPSGPVSIPNPSLIGLYAARDSGGSGGQMINVFNCNFKMISHSSGSTYSFGAYLYGAELDSFVEDTLTADYPLVVTLPNAFSQHSAFIPESTASISATEDTFRDMELESSGLGPGAYFNGTWDILLQGHIYNFSGASSSYGYAIEMVSSNRHMNVNIRQEGYPGFLYVNLSLMNSNINGTDAPFSSETPLHAVEFEDASSQILGDRFNINDEYPTSTTNYYYDATSGATPGVLALDHVYFYCGNQSNCVDIPIGNYLPGGYSAYEHGVTWSGSSTNRNPAILINGPLYGSFTIPVTTVSANSCVNLPSVTAATGLQSIVALSNTDWYNMMVGVVPGSGSFTPSLCNITSSSITTGASGIEYWKVTQ